MMRLDRGLRIETEIERNCSMKKRFWIVTLPVCFAILLAVSWLGFAGSLTPPAGPITGSIRAWGDAGIDLATFGAVNCRVEGVLAAFNVGNGISTGTDCTVLNCSAYQNSGNGISGGNGGTVSNCSAAFNGAAGVSTG